MDNYPVTLPPDHAPPAAEPLVPAGSISTDRLRLDPVSAAEVDALIIQSRLPGWAPDFPQPMDHDSARQVFEEGLLAAADPALTTRLIREESTASVVGSIGFLPLSDGAVEVSYSVAPSRRGRGYATEALIALARNALQQPDISSVIAYTEVENTASQELLLTAGFLPVEGAGLSLCFTLTNAQLPEASL